MMEAPAEMPGFLLSCGNIDSRKGLVAVFRAMVIREIAEREGESSANATIKTARYLALNIVRRIFGDFRSRCLSQGKHPWVSLRF
ncbi:hypothetical protein [Agrobacterium pusense]|uniref:hypothetical protein n=1 Tax=Agrobacterium pusense TaxID=648995 RepID=UPI002F4205ED